jgi:phage terminase small subunit
VITLHAYSKIAWFEGERFPLQESETELKKQRKKKVGSAADGKRRPMNPSRQRMKVVESIPRSRSIAQRARKSDYSKSGSKSQLKKRKKKRCGSTETATNLPCQITIFPCTRHTPDGKRRPRKLSLRRAKLAQHIPHSKSIAEAARKAGYSKSVSQSGVYQIVGVPEIQEAIDREASTLHSAAAKEDLDLPIDDKRVNQVRANFYSELDDLVRRAQDGGIPLTREEAIEKLKPVCEQVFGKAVVDAAMNASETASKANPNFDAAVEEVFQTANDAGIRITRGLAIRMLEPLFGIGPTRRCCWVWLRLSTAISGNARRRALGQQRLVVFIPDVRSVALRQSQGEHAS